ncbi:acyl carrier protein [Parabacteroides sp. PF5-5]|uniref:acyl carrier protein n=1 Tax=unclassified Parabacteroides TaxID=2649774 RepID=UPI002473CD5D|nr:MULTISPECIES: acyl carrier protein [unclassified Parabacteroides]MDH6306517.1 acyl carrier protein [Parabacteroides sp. PH5-39]MDH6317484.1 acyl carrier protein [Parabacteroides sp. PF5-13]MDH6321213.1 acyl carrier protein [Parabacteroides sp. PH5-13]MDH6324945.1 acyl carrier protein [Parabacteroides sp. PH5-8]MDH6328654.1 acyl carrier protein [Parabacteroides sp. PH5-41]
MDTAIIAKKQQSEIVFEQLKEFVADIIGSDVIEEIGITKESVFTKNLEMDSIEIVAFAEKVKKKYGHEIDFISWISQMKFQDLYNLSVGQVVDYIVSGHDSN